MECTELSDLEEGEILEYECCSPGNSSIEEQKDFGVKFIGEKYQRSLEKKSEAQDLKLSVFNFSKCSNGFVNEVINKKFKATNSGTRPLHKDLRLDSISSSEGEYRSDENESENKSVKTCRNKRTYGEKSGEKRSDHKTYGTVEDIMSEIGETICRKSRCNYKKRRTKKRYDDGDYQKLFSSRSPKKHGKRRKSTSDSDLEILIEKNLKKDLFKKERSGCKKKRREIYYQSEATNEESTGTEKKVRDFDEVRKYLLEKLRKQKEEEMQKMHGSENSLEKSEIQRNVDKLTDYSNCSNNSVKDGRPFSEALPENDEDEEMDLKSTNYVDSPEKTDEKTFQEASAENDKFGKLNSNRTNHVEEPEKDKTSAECDEDDEIDIIELRTVALASHRQRRNARTSTKNENSVESREGRSEKNDDDADLDRNELLLRAEALKTALLKKHQKRLKKLKEEKTNFVESCSGNGGLCPSSPEALDVDSFSKVNFPCEGGNTLDADSFKENVSNETEFKGKNAEVHVCEQTGEQRDKVAVALTTGVIPKKTNLKGKTKKKKRKTVSAVADVKENDKKEVGEEDDIMLRSQLLCDLIKKQSLKKLEKKSVLLESIQTSGNKPPTVVNQKSELLANPPTANNQHKLMSLNLPKRKAVKHMPKIPKPEIQRIIIHLGADDSSDEEPGQSPSDSSPPKEDKAEERTVPNPCTVSKESGESLQARYERSVEMLLSQARKKIEGEKEKSSNSHLATPEAVYKHLPPSQRLEYIKLKQKIAERERLRKVKLGIVSKPKNTSTETPGTTGSTGALATSVGTKPPEIIGIKSNSDFQNGVVANISTSSKLVNVNKSAENGSRGGVNSGSPNRKNVAKNSGGTPKSSPPGTVSEKQVLISKLKLLLKKIKIEKTIEENYEKEIRKLKNQLTLFEKKKIEQRIKIKKLWDESMKIYKVTQPSGNGTRTEVKKIEGKKAKEKDAKRKEEEEKTDDRVEKCTEGQEKPESEGLTPNSPEVAAKPKTDIIEIGEVKEKKSECGAEGKASSSSVTDLAIYNSPLQVFNKASGSAERVDPNVIMCHFDLMGVCKDDECTYQHLRTS